MRGDVGKTGEEYENPHAGERRRHPSPEPLDEHLSLDNSSPIHQNGPKRRRVNLYFDRDPNSDFELNLPPPRLQAGCSPQDEEGSNSKNESDHSDVDEDPEPHCDAAGPIGQLELRIHNISHLIAKSATEDIKIVSPIATTIRCLPWRILFMIRAESKSVGFFLQCNTDCHTAWSCHAHAKLTIVAQKPGTESHTKPISHTFSPKENDWGFSMFLPFTEIMDPSKGFVIPRTRAGRTRSRSISEEQLHPETPLSRKRSGSFRPARMDRLRREREYGIRGAEPDSLLLRIRVYADAPHGSDCWDSKKYTGFVGLRNQGATCYINSLLQTLFFTNELRRAVFLMPTESDEPLKSIPLALQRLFFDLQFNERSVSTKRLTTSFGWASWESLMQHDVQEFCRILMDKIETKMKGTSVESTIPNLLGGKMISYIRCKHVPYESKKVENFYDIQLKVKGNTNIYEAFKEYTSVETMDGDNKYDAGEHGLQEAEKGVIFESFPPVLHLQLMRFQYDPRTGANAKVNDRFDFPYKLQLDHFLENPDPDDPADFILHAVLVHSGDNHSGHYVVYINVFDDNRWFKFDDDVVSRCTTREAINSNYGSYGDEMKGAYRNCTNAYLLVYIRESSLSRLQRPVLEEDIPESLINRLKEERRIEAENRRAKAEAHNYGTVVFLLDEDFYGLQGFDLCTSEGIPSRHLSVHKSSTVPQLINIVADYFRTPANRIRLWRVTSKGNLTLRFTPLLPSPENSPIKKQALPSAASVEDPMKALTALTNSYQQQQHQLQSRSPSKTSRVVPSSGSGDGPLFQSSSPVAVWVQILPPSLPQSLIPPCQNEALCFLKFYAPPTPMLLKLSPLLNVAKMGTLSYVGWISVPLDAPLSSILPELRFRAALPADVPLVIYEENGVKELVSLTPHLASQTTVRESLEVEDEMETFILVYQEDVTSSTAISAKKTSEEADTDTSRRIRNGSAKETDKESSGSETRQESAVAVPSSLSAVRRPVPGARLAALKLVSRSKKTLNMCGSTRSAFAQHAKEVAFTKDFTNLVSPGRAEGLPVAETDHLSAVLANHAHPSHFSIRTFYHELSGIFSVAFHQISFKWHKLPTLLEREPFAVVTGTPQYQLCLPGIPMGSGSLVYKSSQIMEAVLRSEKGPLFSVLISSNQTLKELCEIVASHISVPANQIQIFTGCKKSEYRLISSLLWDWRAKELLSPAGQPTVRHKDSEKSSPGIQLTFQCLSIPATVAEHLRQLRCAFVHHRRLTELWRLLLIVPQHWTVARVLQLVRQELLTLEGYAQLERENRSRNGQPPKLRLLETFGTWIIQQYPSDEIVSRIQVMDNRLLRVELMTPDEKEFFDAYEDLEDVPLMGANSANLSDAENGEESQQEGGEPYLPGAVGVPPGVPMTFSSASPTTDSSSAAESSSSSSAAPDAGPLVSPPSSSSDKPPSAPNPPSQPTGPQEREPGNYDLDEPELPRGAVGNVDDDDGASSSRGDNGSTTGASSSNSSSGIADPNNLSLICNVDDDDDEDDCDDDCINDPLKFLERDSDEDDMDGSEIRRAIPHADDEAMPVVPPAPPGGDADDDEAMESEDNEEDEEEEEMPLIANHRPVRTSAGTTIENLPACTLDDSSVLPVVCSLFSREVGSNALAPGPHPFTMILRHNEVLPSLLSRIAIHLGLPIERVAKWRLAVLCGPVSPATVACVGLPRLSPTQESLMRMHNSYKYLPVMEGDVTRLDLGIFMPSPILRRYGERRSLMLFGLRPWLGIEVPPGIDPRKVLLSSPLNYSSLQQQHQVTSQPPAATAAIKRKSSSPVGKFSSSEKPIRILN